MNIIGPDVHRERDIEAVLRTLPQWFGIETALLMYAADSVNRPTFAVESTERLVGFVTLTCHFSQAWEVHCIAVSAACRGQGIGSILLDRAQRHVRDRGARFLQVKTVAACAPSAEYEQTRRFYAARGFVPIEVFPDLWSPRNPALQLLKALA